MSSYDKDDRITIGSDKWVVRDVYNRDGVRVVVGLVDPANPHHGTAFSADTLDRMIAEGLAVREASDTTVQDTRQRLTEYANEFPYAGINRANAAPAAFAALRRVLDECERAITDSSPERRRVIVNIQNAITAALADGDDRP